MARGVIEWGNRRETTMFLDEMRKEGILGPHLHQLRKVRQIRIRERTNNRKGRRRRIVIENYVTRGEQTDKRGTEAIPNAHDHDTTQFHEKTRDGTQKPPRPEQIDPL